MGPNEKRALQEEADEALKKERANLKKESERLKSNTERSKRERLMRCESRMLDYLVARSRNTREKVWS